MVLDGLEGGDEDGLKGGGLGGELDNGLAATAQPRSKEDNVHKPQVS